MPRAGPCTQLPPRLSRANVMHMNPNTNAIGSMWRSNRPHARRLALCAGRIVRCAARRAVHPTATAVVARERDAHESEYERDRQHVALEMVRRRRDHDAHQQQERHVPAQRAPAAQRELRGPDEQRSKLFAGAVIMTPINSRSGICQLSARQRRSASSAAPMSNVSVT